MVIQGWSLQQRYGSATPPTFVQPANNPVN
jgi:hypothetical protein